MAHFAESAAPSWIRSRSVLASALERTQRSEKPLPISAAGIGPGAPAAAGSEKADAFPKRQEK